jgi:hypothetical protein
MMAMPPRRLLIVAMAAVAICLGSLFAYRAITAPRRTTPLYDPPVLAGQQLWGPCAGGVYARHGDRVVLTSTGHCTAEGTVAYEADGVTRRGVFGPAARDATCVYPGHTCASSDINYLVVDEARIPWGYLNVVDMGTGGYRTLARDAKPLGCDDIRIGDRVEINGRGEYRAGLVLEKGDNLKDPAQDGAYFPCMVAADIGVTTGDSGGVVLVNGVPGGVTSRSFGGSLGFTPLAEGLQQLALELCTTPDCGLRSG